MGGVLLIVAPLGISSCGGQVQAIVGLILLGLTVEGVVGTQLRVIVQLVGLTREGVISQLVGLMKERVIVQLVGLMKEGVTVSGWYNKRGSYSITG